MKHFLWIILMGGSFFLVRPLNAQMPGPLVMHVASGGENFLVDLARVGNNGQVILSVDDRGNPVLKASGEGEFAYSTLLGPEYGKIVSMNEVDIVYFHDARRAGKLSAIGEVALEYYDPYLGDARAGKLKRVGSVELDYFLEMDGDVKKGRLSSVGGTPVDYYYGGNLDGKILRVGDVRFHFFIEVPNDVRSGKISAVRGRQPGWIIRLGIQ